jgi:hypothetical protein
VERDIGTTAPAQGLSLLPRRLSDVPSRRDARTAIPFGYPDINSSALVSEEWVILAIDIYDIYNVVFL